MEPAAQAMGLLEGAGDLRSGSWHGRETVPQQQKELVPLGNGNLQQWQVSLREAGRFHGRGGLSAMQAIKRCYFAVLRKLKATNTFSERAKRRPLERVGTVQERTS